MTFVKILRYPLSFVDPTLLNKSIDLVAAAVWQLLLLDIG